MFQWGKGSGRARGRAAAGDSALHAGRLDAFSKPKTLAKFPGLRSGRPGAGPRHPRRLDPRHTIQRGQRARERCGIGGRRGAQPTRGTPGGRAVMCACRASAWCGPQPPPPPLPAGGRALPRTGWRGGRARGRRGRCAARHASPSRPGSRRVRRAPPPLIPHPSPAPPAPPSPASTWRFPHPYSCNCERFVPRWGAHLISRYRCIFAL